MSLWIALLFAVNFHITGPQITIKGTRPVLNDSEFVLPARAGIPAIPMKAYFLAVDGKVLSFNVKNVKTEELEGKFYIPPVPPPAILSAKNPRRATPDPGIYGKNKFYPETPVIFNGTHSLFGQKIATFIFYPYQFNPITGKIQLIKSVDIEIKTSQRKEFIKKSAFGASIVRKFLSSIVSNPQDITYPTPSTGMMDYLIITSSNMSSAFDSLARWYRKFGVQTYVRTVDWISSNYTGRDLAEKIRNYIKVCYRDSGLVFVLLGGDVEEVPARVAYAMTSGAGLVYDEDSIRADLYYSDLDGTWDANNNGIFGEVDDSVDLFPDVFVGRAPVRNQREAMTFVNKVISYENPAPQDRNYLDKLLFFAEVLWQDPFTDEGIAKNMIDSLEIPDSLNVIKLYETLGNENSSTVIVEIERGANLLNHDGHGWYTVMGTGEDYVDTVDMDTLNNAGKYGILYSIGCWVGAFDRDAISEHFIRNPFGGGVAFIGNSRYGWGSPGNPGYGYSDKFDQMFYRTVFRYNITNIGVALAFDKVLFIPYSQDENVYRWHQYQLNLLGDPLMPIWRGRPVEILANLPDTVVSGSTLRLSFQNLYEGTVCVSHDDSIIETEDIINSGAIISIPESLAGNLTLTVHSDGYLPLIHNLFVRGNGAQLSLDTILIRDSGAYPDSLLSPDESGIMRVVIKNWGNMPSEPALLQITSQDSFLSISPDTAFVPSLGPQEADTFLFNYNVGMCRPHLSTIVYKIGQDSSVVRLPITRPIFSASPISEPMIPGDTTRLVFTLVNISPSPARDVVIHITSFNPFVHVNDTFQFDEISPGGLVDCTVSVYITDAASTGDRFSLIFDYLASGYRDTLTIEGIIGNTIYVEDFEDSLPGWTLGPHWSIVSRRHIQGNRSLYCGNTQTWSYGNNWNTQALSPPIVLSYEPEISFALWYGVATYGSDGIYLKVLHEGRVDTLDFLGSGGALDSLMPYVNSWAIYRYPLTGFHPGDTIRVAFQFVSDGSDTYEGFYIDAFTVTGYTLNPLDINERGGREDIRILYATGGFRLILPERFTGEVKVYDTSGRLVRKIMLRERKNIDVHGLGSGVYFVRIGSRTFRAVVVK